MPQGEQTQTSRSTTKSGLPVSVMLSWNIVVVNSFSIPVVIIVLHIFFDVVPFYPKIGAFIMAAGAISIVSSFSSFVKYKTINETVATTWHKTKKINKKELKELISKMYFVAAMAEIPSLAGLLYFLATRDLIASLILCIPAVVMAAICRPILPDLVLAKLK